jgi:hypothetical protein
VFPTGHQEPEGPESSGAACDSFCKSVGHPTKEQSPEGKGVEPQPVYLPSI